MARVGQPNFSKGEIAEELVARIDVAAYSTALRRARNVTILKYGGVTKRPGTRLVAEVYADQGVRLMPFQFSLTQTYALEMGQGYMRPAAQGGLVLEDKLTIQSIAFGATTTVEANYHGYSVGDQVYYSGTSIPELDGRIGRVVSVGDVNHYTVDINSTGFTSLTADSGGTIRLGAPTPPPPPPPVPPPAPTPAPPETGGGGGGGDYGGGGGSGTCPTADSLWLMANESLDGPGIEKPGNLLFVGDHVWTQHPATEQWGAFPIERVSFVMADVLKADELPQALAEIPQRPLRATFDHPFGGYPWKLMRDYGKPDGHEKVAVVTVTDAHTYVVNGVLSHNKTQYPDL